ncbi:deleted in autism protein 1 homolog [Plakobranchus ocellatus]|uniref:Deleted in autism protein 1 homolog n=1 Tax=Plakobranchus ocellatus TaxID=259542 RepID=A0AAV4DNZ2_9GAST|nr:deleted in autism protein 1 homolog [Plakobranchus ocellatus]
MNSELRNRKSENNFKAGMARFENVMGDSVLKMKMMPSRFKAIFFLSAVLSLAFYLYLANWLFRSNPEDDVESLFNTDKCPACYGGSACGMFYYKQIELSGISKFRTLDILNGKNVHFATMRPDGREVVVKKLAADTQLRELDEKLCVEAKRPVGCDIARVITRTDRVLPFRTEPLLPKHLKGTGAFMFSCPSYRLLDAVWTKFQEYKKKNEIFLSDKVQVFYMSLVNQESLLLQTFPKSEGWPFPEYLGSCGRGIVVENAGRPLSQFVDSSFLIRAGIAYELMKIADTLTTKSDFALYLTDVNYENFAVDHSGKVTVIDLENIIVVDKLSIQARKPTGFDQPYEAIFSDCEGTNCLLFQSEELCKHLNSDHNYNAICRNLLSSYAVEPGMPQGFLHSMPEEAKDYWDLEHLLEECARPRQPGGRWRVKDKLIKALEALKDGSLDHQKVLGEEKD